MSTELVATPNDADDPIARLVETWLAGRKSVHTRDAYRRDLRSWLDWCADAAAPPLDTWPAHVQLWLAELQRRGESGSTQARRLGAVSSWYGWLVRHQAAPRNPAHLERAERPVRAPRKAPALSDQQAGALLAAADADPNPRAAAIVALMLFTGMRVGELIAANVADLGVDRGHPVLHLRGKGGKARVAAILPVTYERLEAYQLSRAAADTRPVIAEQAGAGSDRPLIATTRGARIDRKEVRRLLQRLARAAGLPDELATRLSPHSTRATYATASLDAGAPVRDVQYALGHASPLTTEGYDRSSLSPDRNPAYRLLARFTVPDNADPH